MTLQYPLGASVPTGLVHKRISNLNSLHTLQLAASSNVCPVFKILSVGLKVIHSFKPSYLCKPNQVCLPHVSDVLTPLPLLHHPILYHLCPVQSGTPSHLATSWRNALPFDLVSSSDLLSIFKVRLKTFFCSSYF